jgi:Ca2+-binding EF-hand superfamily protein
MEENTVRCSYLEEMRKAFAHFDKDGNGLISPQVHLYFCNFTFVIL